MATAKSKAYWQKRFEQLNDALLRDAVEYYDGVERMYRDAMNRIEKDIAQWYMRLAVNNEMSYAEAKKLLTKSQLEDFKMTLEEYIRRGKENGVSADWSKSLENASAKFHISRLEALQLQIQQHLETLYSNQLDGMDETMRNTYRNGYYRTAYELQKGFQTGFDVQQIDDAKLEKIMGKPWAVDGLNFSDRIWGDKDKLLRNLQSELVQGLVRGDGQLKITQRFAKRMNSSLSNAGRLIATESAYFGSLSEKDSMKDLGVEQYEILATLDSKTSEICRSLDGHVFKMSEFQPGITAPPFHPWCRSCTVPHVEGLDGGLRAARDESGNTEYIPGSMTYEDWKSVYVDKSKTLDGWRKNNGKEEDSAGGSANNDNKSTLDVQVERFLKGELSDRKLLGEEILKEYSVIGVPVNIQTMLDNGYCSILINGDRLKIVDYNLAANDARDIKYQLKTAFHEAYHASGNGYETDYSSTHSVRWLNLEETFAEVTAHYKVSLYGVTDLTPAYADKLVSMLPRLKQLPEFSSCVKPIDFGKVALDKRLNGGGSVWVPLSKKVMRRKFSFADYVTQYFSEIRGDIEGYVDKILENMPSCASNKRYMIADLEKAMGNVEEFGHTLSDNESLMLNNAVAVAMNRIGVK